MPPSLSHIAVLVRSVAAATQVCKNSGFLPGVVEDFAGEGTREAYVGPESAQGLLLLMEAIGPGPYQRALEKRGPGLHHIAVNVASIDHYVADLVGSGWLMHPASLRTLKQNKTVYLARPGLQVLIEVQEQPSSGPPSFIEEVHVEGESHHQRLLDALNVDGLSIVGKSGSGIVIGGEKFLTTNLSA